MLLQDAGNLLQPARPRFAIEVESILGINFRAGAEEVVQQCVIGHMLEKR